MPVVRTAVLTMCVGLLAAPSAAQSRDTVAGVGVSLLRSDGVTAVGVALDIAHGFRTDELVTVGPVGDFGVHRTGDLVITSWMGGGRLTVGPAAARGFGQVLAGVERYRGVSDVVWQPGGGVEVRVTERLNLRGQFDVRVARVESNGVTFRSREYRFTIGASLPF